MKPYRQGIVAVIMNDQNQVLLCERSDVRGAWQFPQGGVEDGESFEQAFFREIKEELGNDQCEIIKVGKGTTKYEWPEPGKKYVGQEHTWFLAKFLTGELPHLENSDFCFASWKWVSATEALKKTVNWKKDSVEKGLNILGLI